jgi:hypothetical protein
VGWKIHVKILDPEWPGALQVMTVYAVAIGEPSFGIAAPLAVGLSLLVSVQAGGKFTGK